MEIRKTLSAALGLLLAAACALQAAQFHVPLHMPPHPSFPGGEPGRELYLEAGAARFISKGINIAGPGACFELSALGKAGGGAAVRGCGFSLSGKVDPLGLGRDGGSGFASAVEADLLWAPRGRDGLKFYAGGLVGMSSLDIRDPLNYTLVNGKLVVEPDTAFSLFLGLPLGVELPFGVSENWSGSAQADVALFPAGVTFFSYLGLPGSGLYGTSRGIDPQAAGGARAAFFYRPWKLFIEGAGRLYSGGGNNEAASFVSLLGGIKF
ncbi:MAG: hypothetical protein HY952_12310 [Elusimicrobia bacterium]|nr:hypothetical protein [Elusimicrobiota bacterium]